MIIILFGVFVLLSDVTFINLHLVISGTEPKQTEKYSKYE